MDLKHLPDIHTGRHAQRVQHDIQRASVRQERHILHREHAGNDTLVTMASCHLISDGDLSLLRDVDAHCLVHARRQLITVLPREHLRIHNDAILTVRHFQGSIPYLARLLAEDRAEEPLLCGQLCLSLRSHLSDKDIPCAHFRADADDTSLVKIFQGIVAHARDISCDLLRSELCISRLCLIFLDMDRSIYVILYQSLT